MRCWRQVKEKAPQAADQVAGDMEQVAQKVSEQAVPTARNVGKEVEDGAQRLKKNAGPAADDAVAGARKARAHPYPCACLWRLHANRSCEDGVCVKQCFHG